MTLKKIILILFLINLTYSNTQTPWSQIGDDIDGQTQDDLLGEDISLSSDGYTMAVSGKFQSSGAYGKVQIFTWNGVSWTQKGNDIIGDNSGDLFGRSLYLSGDGGTIIIGSAFAGTGGQVKVYEWDGGIWVQKGSPISGDATNDRFGDCSSISKNGDIIAIGAIYNDDNGSNAGQAKVYEWNGTNWIQKGSSLVGEEVNSRFGTAIDLDDTGLTLSVSSAAFNGCIPAQTGKTYIYSWDGSNWIQKGNIILGENIGDISGADISLNKDGNTIAIGAFGNDDEGIGTGYTRVFSYDGNQWIQKGSNINGEEPDELLGSKVCLDESGTKLIIVSSSYSGPNFNFPSDHSRGRAQIFEWNGTEWIQLGLSILGEYSEDHTNNAHISRDGNVFAVSAVWNSENGNSSGHVRVFEFSDLAKIDNNQTNKLIIYPNPAINFINVDVEENGYKIKIFDITGKVVLQSNLANKTINISGLIKGIYFIQIETENNQMMEKLIVN